MHCSATALPFSDSQIFHLMILLTTAWTQLAWWKNLSTLTIVVPVLCATYSSFCKNSANPRSDIFLPYSFCIPFRFKSSIHMTAYSPQSLFASFQWKSFLLLAVFLYSLQRSFFIRFLLTEPCFFLASLLFALAMALLLLLKNMGDSISCPSDAVRNVFKPKSKPTLVPVLAKTLLSSSYTRNRYRYLQGYLSWL